jgi:hypothetical protein
MIALDGAGLCRCRLGYSGEQCEERGYCETAQIAVHDGNDECNAGCCSGHGVCSALDGGQCVCDFGFHGARCEQQGCTLDQIVSGAGSDECDAVCCSGSGQCEEGGSCTCEIGFSGGACQLLGCTEHQIILAAAFGGEEGTRCDTLCCGAHGRCNMDGRCDCNLGYLGETCGDRGCSANHIQHVATEGINLAQCADLCCAGRGSCSAIAEGSCECDLGYGPEQSASAELLCGTSNNTCTVAQISRASSQPLCSDVCCGGRGDCSPDGTCLCGADYHGVRCEHGP